MLFLIPARAGSKRLPGKNKRLFCGLPLWHWSMETAIRCKQEDDEVMLSTDDMKILCAALARGPYAQLRPEILSGDNATSRSLVDWTFDIRPDESAICLLQPTSPTRPDSLVRQLIAHGGQVRSVTNGVPNGQCWVYRRGHAGWIDIETEKGHDIDTLEDFEAAERDMMRRFA